MVDDEETVRGEAENKLMNRSKKIRDAAYSNSTPPEVLAELSRDEDSQVKQSAEENLAKRQK